MKIKGSVRISKQVLSIAIIVFILLGFEIYTIAAGHTEEQADLPENYGNFQSNIDAMARQTPKEGFSFVVAGDMEGSDTFETLCEKLRNKPISFMVMLGDLVEECGKVNHAHFIYECAEKYRLPFPVFIVAGNRDVAYDEAEQDIDKVSLTDFEKMYGKSNFSFEYNKCLFIGLCILPPPYSTGKSIEFLEATLAKKQKDIKKVFIFMHMPPVLKPDSVTACCANVQELVDIINNNKVDYVISAHYHGYRKTEYGDTTFLVSGGGGGNLDETEAFGGLHHAVVLTVNNESVSEEMIFAQQNTNISGAVQHYATTNLYPFFTRHPVLAIVENLVLICGTFFTVSLARKRKYEL